MSTIIRVEDGTLNVKNGAFVCFYTEPVQIYKHHIEKEEHPFYDTLFPLMGIVMRWDNTFGYPGGSVDAGETPLDAAVREVREELGYEVDPLDLTLISSHKCSEKFTSHMFCCKVTEDEMYLIRDLSSKNAFGKAEAAGFNVCHIYDESIKNSQNLNFAGSGKEEFDLMLKHILHG